MKKRVCCLLLVFTILGSPTQNVQAAPIVSATEVEEQEEKKLPHEAKLPHETKLPHEAKLPHEEKLPHEKKLPHEVKKPHEEKKGPEIGPAHEKLPGPLAEKPEPPTPPTPPEPLEPPTPPTPQKGVKPVIAPPEVVISPAVTEPEITNPEPIVTPEAEEIIPENQQNGSVVVEPEADTEVTLRQEVVEFALQFVGNPYKWGGTSLTNGADCSGFVQSVYAHFNCSLPRVSREQAVSAGYKEVSVKESELLPGDLVFYANNSGVVYHVALYIGDGKVVHAANSNQGIIVSEYTYMKPYKARRVIE